MNDVRSVSLTGSLIANRYLVLDLVASGGYGAVFKVQCRDMDKVCAAKLLKVDVSNETSVKRLQQEGRLLCGLKHPNIVSVDAMTLDPQLGVVLIMDYLNGVPLSEYMKSATLEDKLSLFKQVCDGLQFVHENGVIHRDVKPSNIMVVDGRAVLIDFGIAKSQDDFQKLTGTDMFVGTPGYMSPEYCRTGCSDHRGDIYALGCLLFELVSGRPPFVGTTPLEVMSQHLIASIPQLAESEGQPVGLQIVVEKCLRKEPSERYATCSDLKADVEAVMRGEKVIPPGVSHAQQSREHRKIPTPWIMGGTAASLMAFLGYLCLPSLLNKTPSSDPVALSDNNHRVEFRRCMNEEKFSEAVAHATALRESYAKNQSDPVTLAKLRAEASWLEGEALSKVNRVRESDAAYETAFVGFEKLQRKEQLTKCLWAAGWDALNLKRYEVAHQRLTRMEHLDPSFDYAHVQVVLAETEVKLSRTNQATARLHALIKTGEPEQAARARDALMHLKLLQPQVVSPAKTR